MGFRMFWGISVRSDAHGTISEGFMKHAREFILDLNKRQKSTKVKKGALSATFHSNLSRIQYYPRERPSSRRGANPIFSLNILNFHRQPKNMRLKNWFAWTVSYVDPLLLSITVVSFCSIQLIRYNTFCCAAKLPVACMHACP